MVYSRLPFPEPKWEVPTIYKAYFQVLHPKFKGLYQQNMAKNMVLTYLHLGS